MSAIRGFLGEPDFWEHEADAPILKRNDNKWLENHVDEAMAHAQRWLKALDISETNLEIDTTPVEETNRIFRADADRTYRLERHKLIYIKLISFAVKKFGDHQQTMGFVAGVLLLFFDPATTFKVLTVLNDSPRYLNGYWRGEATQCACDGYVAMQLYSNQALMEHIRGMGLLPETFVQKWFAGLCINHLPYHVLFIFLDHFFDHGSSFLFAFFSAFFDEFAEKLKSITSTTEANEVLRLKTEDETKLLRAIEKAGQSAPTFLKDVNLFQLRCQCYHDSLSKRMQSANEAMFEKLDDDDDFDEDDDEEDDETDQLTQQMAAASLTTAGPSVDLSVDLHGDRVEHFIPGLFALAFFMLAITGLKKCWSFWKPAPGLQEPLRL